jgi:threonine dehydratase
VRVIAVAPENAACFLAACGNGHRATAAVAPTLADGLAVARIGEKPFALAAPRVDDVVTVSERDLALAMRVLACREGIVAEGAGAAATAALLAGKVRGRDVVAVIGGRNVDPRVHERIVTSGTRLNELQPWPHAA